LPGTHVTLLVVVCCLAQQVYGQITRAPQSKLKDEFESRVRVEWDVFKNKDKNVYESLLADDFAAASISTA